MKSARIKFLLLSMSVSLFSIQTIAQDDDGIYGDIYESPTVEEVEVDSNSPLDGYSTVDDYYPEEGYTAPSNSNQPYSEQYVDENGNNITNNYYGDYYEDNDYAYASRIRRFHRFNNGWGYYDPWYTNMYYYNYDPFFWGTSIYVGAWPSWGWNYGWGWNTWGVGFGWNSWGWNNCWGGGWNGWGWNSPYWNGYNNGYWNGFNDGLAYGGYYNTYDPYSGIYYGPRGAGGTGTTIGSGVRSNSFASVYNDAAKAGKVHHANKENVLQTADARPVAGNLDGYQVRPNSSKGGAAATERQSVPQVRSEVSKERGQSGQTANSNNIYQRNSGQRATSVPERSISANADRSRQRIETHSSRTRAQSNTSRPNTYYRGNTSTRIDQRQPSRSATENRGNMYRDLQRTQPSQNGYYRGNSNDSRQQPSRPGSDYRREDYTRPSNDQRNNNYKPPTRNYQPPTRTAPSRGTQPSRSVSPSPAPNRGSSKGSYTPSPSRSSGSGYSPSSGGSRGSSGSPSRGSSGSRSKGGRP